MSESVFPTRPRAVFALFMLLCVGIVMDSNAASSIAASSATRAAPRTAGTTVAPGKGASAQQPQPTREMTEQQARNILAQELENKLAFMKKLTAELVAAGFPNDDTVQYNSPLRKALNYCWVVRDNPVRLAAARTILLDTTRMPAARVDALDREHAASIAQIAEQRYPAAAQLRYNNKDAGSELLWRNAAARAQEEREVSPFLDRLQGMLSEKQRGRFNTDLAAHLFAYAHDKEVMQALPGLLARHPSLSDFSYELEKEQKNNPGGVRDFLLAYHLKKNFARDYRLLAQESISLSLAAYLPDFARQLQMSGTGAAKDFAHAEEGEKTTSAHTASVNQNGTVVQENAEGHILGLREGLHGNGLRVTRQAGSNAAELWQRVAGNASVFQVQGETLGSVYRAYPSGSAPQAVFPIFATPPKGMLVYPFQAMVPVTPPPASAEADSERTSIEALLFVVPGQDEAAAGKALAAAMSAFSVVLSDLPAAKRGQVTTVADFANPFSSYTIRSGPEMSEAIPSGYTETYGVSLRFARPWSVPLFLTLAERASPEQLRALFGPASAVLLRVGKTSSWYLLEYAPLTAAPEKAAPAVPPDSTPVAMLGNRPVPVLPDSFIAALSQRELALLEMYIDDLYAVLKKPGSLRQEMEKHITAAGIPGLELRCGLHLMAVIAEYRYNRGQEFADKVGKLLSDTAQPLHLRVKTLQEQVSDLYWL